MSLEILSYFLVGVICVVFLIFKRSYFSCGVLGLSTIMLFYLFILSIFRFEVSITTMNWPISNQGLVEISNLIIVFIVIFFFTNILVDFLFFEKKTKIFSPHVHEKKVKVKYKRFFLGLMSVGVCTLVITADGWWVFAPYPESKEIWSTFKLKGAGFLILLSFLIGFKNGLRLGGIYKKIAYIIIIIVCLHFVLSGDRGSLLFLLIGVTIIYYLNASLVRKRLLIIAFFPCSVIFFLFLEKISLWRSWNTVSPSSGLGDFISNIDLLPQALAHLAHSIKIVAVYGPNFDYIENFFCKLWIQIIPSIFLRLFDYELYNGPWRLASYVRHGGGFFVPAEIYFVGGSLGVFLITIYFALLSSFNDRILDIVATEGVERGFQRIEVIVACLALGSLPYSFFYGIQSFHRMIVLPIAVCVISYLLKRVKKSAKISKF